MNAKRPRKELMFKCINPDFVDERPDKTQEIILEQWKTYVDSAERISEQRQQFVNWFNGVNGLIVAAFAGVLKFVHIEQIPESLFILKALPPLIGMSISITTILRILVYRERKKNKYAQIYTLEKFLPFKLYTNEYKMRKRMRINILKFNIRSGTRLELLIPCLFLLVYLVMFFWALFS